MIRTTIFVCLAVITHANEFCSIIDRPTDIMWLLDESGSISSNEFQQSKELVIEYSTGVKFNTQDDRFKLGLPDTRFGFM